jgi:hypothetical protein
LSTAEDVARSAASAASIPRRSSSDNSSPKAVGEDRDLDLLEDHAHHANTVACLEEERAVARLADGAGHETFRWIEKVTASRHDRTLYRFAVRPSSSVRTQK